jgi:LytS/YehU family sensor histidine kinase
MNPHFIFNALGSIQRYLLENKSTEAGLYLSRFARLIRQNMNSLKTNSINIEEEVERLRNYIELENFRMNNKFEYLIEVDKNLDDFEISIPSMIIQPFVENAIWHGISSIDFQGEIRIFFKSIDDTSIQIIVEDNGVGMAYSESFKNNSKGLKMGIGITEKRLQLIGERENVKTMITTSEVFPSTNFPGTRVTIIAPVLGSLS